MNNMKVGIHPKYKQIKVLCSCGSSFEIGSTMSVDSINIEVCSNCHLFYTGNQKMVDTAGRVEKFQKKYGGCSL